MPKLTLNASKNTKHTPAGEIPVDWGWASLDNLTFKDKRISYGIVQPGDHCPEGYLLIRSQDYSKGWASVDTMMRVTELVEKPYKRSRVSSNDLLITVVGAGIGNLAIVPDYLNGANISRSVARISIDGQRANSRFVYHFLQVGIRQLLQINSTGGAQPVLNLDELRRFPIPLPPLAEQRKIANILSTWEVSLDALDALIAAKDRQKQALMQQLLTGKTRVKGAKRKWKKLRFGEWLTESRITGTDGTNAKKITVKLYGRGVYPKQDRLVGSENTKYYVRKAGQFIYSKLDFLNGAFGIVPESLDGYESTLDLPSFEVSPNADAKWLLFYVTRPEFYTQQLGAAAGGRKARRVNPSEFLAMKILAPDLAEQQQIAAILDTADQELTLLRTQRQTLDQQKRGLMQRLLTGKIRVTPTPESDV